MLCQFWVGCVLQNTHHLLICSMRFVWFSLLFMVMANEEHIVFLQRMKIWVFLSKIIIEQACAWHMTFFWFSLLFMSMTNKEHTVCQQRMKIWYFFFFCLKLSLNEHVHTHEICVTKLQKLGEVYIRVQHLRGVCNRS